VIDDHHHEDINSSSDKTVNLEELQDAENDLFGDVDEGFGEATGNLNPELFSLIKATLESEENQLNLSSEIQTEGKRPVIL
jgi:hypothetical protein